VDKTNPIRGIIHCIDNLYTMEQPEEIQALIIEDPAEENICDSCQ